MTRHEAAQSERHRIPVRRGSDRGASQEPSQVPEVDASPELDAEIEGAVPVSADVVDRMDVDQVNWRDLALRLRADMENYRRRQQKWAEMQVAREKSQLLTAILEVVDLVEQIARHDTGSGHSMELVRGTLLKVLKDEGVEPLEALHQPFDPTYHEAVSMVPPVSGQPVPLWVVAEERRGYRLGDTLLRPARVVVAGER